MMHVFHTRMGVCGVDYLREALTSVKLLDSDASPGDSKPPKAVIAAARAIERHLGGSPQDLTGLAIDVAALPPFHRTVYEAARRIASGTTTTYGELAAAVGSPRASRAVGRAMATNPLLIVVPCHRVLASGGALGGFSAPGGAATKRKLLALEGAWPLVKSAPPPFDAARAVRHLSAQDDALGKHIERVGPLRLRVVPAPSLFFALGRAIIFQQLSGKAAATIHARYRLLFDDGVPEPEAHARLSDEQLRGVGVSASKARSLLELADKSLSGSLPSLGALGAMRDDEIIDALTAVRGIGAWTVQMLLMFSLGRADVLPADDYGVRKGFQRLHHAREMPTPAELTRHGERWAPYRTVASWYLWRVPSDNEPG